MKEKFHHLFKEKRFRKEFRREMRLLIIVTLGFTIAFTWRQTIFDLFYAFARWATHANNNAMISVLASILITIVSIVLIYFTAHFLKGREKY